jgi:hypothetical protein
MKTINLTFVIAMFLFAFNVQAKEKIVIKKENGGPKGYRNVKEVHSGGTHKLSCSEPGTEQCSWIEGFTIVTGSQLAAIDKFIEDKIGDNDYSGTGNLSGTNLWFCWGYDNATGTTTYSITEDAPDCSFE